jgi:SAM-dependent methyltransferase
MWYKQTAKRLDFEIQNCSITDFVNVKRANLAIAVFTVLSYILKEEELEKSLQNIHHHLKPNGYFLFDLPKPLFFSLNEPQKKTIGSLERVISITHDYEEVYWYKETCKDSEFGWEYKELFKIRNWNTIYVSQLLEKIGFEREAFDCSILDFTGADYLLFKKKG